MQGKPDQELETDDPGDDVALRFNYQHSYAAISALRLIQPHYPCIAVICENHEDFLIQEADESFVAVQIKTRDVAQPPFKAKEEQVINALARFAQLEAKYPGVFKCFEFLTNHVFWQNQETDNNLVYLLSALLERGSVKGLRKTNQLRVWVTRICEKSGVKEEQVVMALLKCKCTSRNDTTESARKDVVEALAESGFGDLPYSKVSALAGALVNLAREASTKSSGASVLALYEAGSDFAEVVTNQKLEAKRLTKERVKELIEEIMVAEVEPLSTVQGTALEGLPKTLAILYEKLGRSNLETDRVIQLEDLVHKVEALYVRWVNKFGAPEANRRLNDLKELVKFDCTEAKVAASKAGEPYGPAMYTALLERLQARCATSSDNVYKCRPEHLLGTAGVLTEECTVWWSGEFTLASRGVP